ncbi:putative dihydrodipicolinate synthetase [Mycobacteroides abscessus 1948]|uniref:Putative dihydrodipicolinate synthetase n=1 Tax=Mycobacteroides abscessus 1948 TaxID=1299323 RepID=A0A829QPR3_9MYCO|nr:putative dihydrodipicolinate synthetase [Mycobacteroides abscessus 1948]
MTSTPQFHGIIAYPVTPFLPDDTVDIDRLAELVSRLVDDGAHAIAPLGSTGESAYLEEREFDAVVDTTVAAVNKRVPVIVGASDLTTANTIRRARHAQQAGGRRRDGAADLVLETQRSRDRSALCLGGRGDRYPVDGI